MFQGTLALLNQTLRTDSRKLSVHLFLLLFVGALFGMVYQSSQSRFATGAPGLDLFQQITWVNIVFILVAGISYFGTAISEEKEQGTLGLLKMTGISPLVLLLGKSTSRMIFVLVLLTVQLPFTLLAITMGGVTLSQVLAVYLALASFVFLVANLGLMCSVRAKNNSDLAAYFLAFVFSYVGVVGGLYAAISGHMMRNPSPDSILLFLWPYVKFLAEESVVGRIWFILNTGFSGNLITAQIWIYLFLGVIFFQYALRNFEKFTRDEVVKEKIPESDIILVVKPENKQLYVDRPWKWAVAWKDFHFMAGGYLAMLGKYIAYAGIGFGIPILVLLISSINSSRQFNSFHEIRHLFGGVLLGGSLLIMVVEIIIMAAVMFQLENEWKTLSSLILLPQSLHQTTLEKVGVLIFGLIPAVSFLLLGLLIGPDIVWDYFKHVGVGRIVWLRFFVGIMGFIAFLHLVTYLSLFIKMISVPVSIVLFWFLTFAFIYVMRFDFGNTYNDHIVSQCLWFSGFYACMIPLLIKLIGKRITVLAAR